MENCPALPANGSSVAVIIVLAVLSLIGGVALVRATRRGAAVAVVAAVAVAAASLLLAAPARAASECPSPPTTPATTTPETTAPESTAPLPRIVAVGYTPTGSPPLCNVNITLTNFAPNESFVVSLAHTSNYGANPDQSAWVWNVMTDGTGSAVLTPFSYSSDEAESAQFNATADGVSSGFVLISC